MRLVSTELGRITYLFTADEANPKGGLYLAEFERLLIERYAFPSPPLRPEGGSVRFESGRMIAGDRKVNISALALYNDAVVIETTHTEQSMLVLENFNTWIKQTFGFRELKTKPMLLFESNIVVDFESPTHKTVSIFRELSNGLSAAMKKIYDHEFECDFSGLALASDPTKLPASIAPFLKTEFTINRRLNRPYTDNRYFCIAPMPTETHITLLEAFDKTLSM